jgi:hypothetical protein
MSKTKKILREEYERLKKVFKKMLEPGQQSRQPQLVLQPVRNKKI